MFGADTMAMINAVLPFFLMGGIFYFMLWKPQKKQQQDRQNLLNSLKKGANPTKKEHDTSVVFDFLLIASALSYQILGIAVKNIHILFADINVREEILPHESMVTLRVILWNTHIFIHVESNYIAETNLALLIELD